MSRQPGAGPGAAPAHRSWKAGEPSAAGALLARCVESGIVRQETLDLTSRNNRCFVKFEEMERMANIRAEINEMKLKAEILELEKETADIAHPFYLGQKCELLEDMNTHLEAVLKQQSALNKKLIKSTCEESLPVEVTYHKYVVELLTEAVNVIEKFESHVQTIRSIPQVPEMMKNMDTALNKTVALVMELEELAEQILSWRELQQSVSCSTENLGFTSL
ncbi:HAUS augmin-like complex subunit 2 [Colius striatus]|uniref:HAUS augmin-like complex subunit 2 n=1 Tax=Colius striatus TaxID=57412 RepID=UPI002B1DD9D7|nr:HAUS augmin-like complex subunit 2 [Colius striatus]